jgi:hypothetical protein
VSCQAKHEAADGNAYVANQCPIGRHFEEALSHGTRSRDQGTRDPAVVNGKFPHNQKEQWDCGVLEKPPKPHALR